MEKLCKEVYNRDDTKRLRQRAMLCQIYHLALHDKWHQARDLMLMSHLQTNVEHSDVSTQVGILTCVALLFFFALWYYIRNNIISN